MDAPQLIAEPAHDAPLNPCPRPSPVALACLRRLASSYVWWKTPEEAMRFPHRVAAQVMNLGAWEDLTDLVESAGEDYWHYRLGLAEYGAKPVPPMPVRKTT